MTNDKTNSTLQSKLDLEIFSDDSDSESDKDKSDRELGFYPTFGTKYPYTEALEDTAEDEATTELINVEDLEKQLMDVLDQLANRHSDKT